MQISFHYNSHVQVAEQDDVKCDTGPSVPPMTLPREFHITGIMSFIPLNVTALLSSCRSLKVKP